VLATFVLAERFRQADHGLGYGPGNLGPAHGPRLVPFPQLRDPARRRLQRDDADNVRNLGAEFLTDRQQPQLG
jgi:hypothetical protein